MESRALGRGLAALIPDRKDLDQGDSKDSVVFLKTDVIRDNSQQPRTKYDESKMAELRASIKEKGLLQPILVRPFSEGYEVIAGERRLRAARDLGFQEVPSIVKSVSQQEAFIIALVENIQREELNAIEEALAFKRLISEFHLSFEDVAKAVAKDASTVSNLVRLLNLPQKIQDAVVDGVVSMGHARALLAVIDSQRQKYLFEKTIEKGLSVRELEAMIKSEGHTLLRRPRAVSKERNHEVAMIEDELQRILGSKVRLQPHKKRGKIIIEYYSPDDLDRVLHLLRREKG